MRYRQMLLMPMARRSMMCKSHLFGDNFELLESRNRCIMCEKRPQWSCSGFENIHRLQIFESEEAEK